MLAVVTGTHNRIGYCVVRSLAEAGIPVWAGAATPLGMGCLSRLPTARFHHPHPFRHPEGFIGGLQGLGRRLGRAVLIPAGPEVSVIARCQTRLSPWYRVLLPSSEQIEAVSDKRRLARLCESIGVPVLPTRAASRTSPPDAYPVVVKPSQGSGAWQFHVCRDRTAFLGAVARIRAAGAEPIVQPYTPGRLLGCAILYYRGRRVLRFSYRSLLTLGPDGGTAVLRVGSPEPRAEAMVERLLDHLGWHGVCQCDLLEDETGTPRLIDANSRFWGSLYCATVSGVNFPAASWRLAQGLPVEQGRVRWGLATAWSWGVAAATIRRLLRGRLPRLGGRSACRRLYWDDVSRLDLLPLLLQPIGALDYRIRGRGARQEGAMF